MKLHGIDFGNILGAAGVQGFFGEGYWFHHIPLRKPDFTGMTFVSKTVTLKPREGNIRGGLLETIFPSWARINFLRDLMLNAMGLPNDGIGPSLETGEWQKREKPFMISIASVAETREGRLDELRRMVDIIGPELPTFLSPFGLQINLSCPNTGHNTTELVGESEKAIETAAWLGAPIMLKYSIASAPVSAIMQLNDHSFCAGICVSNTIPFGWPGIDWQKVWGTKKSPLSYLGGGGLSGKVLRPLVCDWIKKLRDTGFGKPINGGGGIFSKDDVDEYKKAGASSVFLGSVALLHPRRLKSIIAYANTLQWG